MVYGHRNQRVVAIIYKKIATIRKKLMISKEPVENIIMGKVFNKIIGEKLKDQNLSEISRKLGIPRSVLQDWIHEGREPSLKNIEYIKKIADFCDLSLEELLTGEMSSKNISTIVFEDENRKYKISINRIK